MSYGLDVPFSYKFPILGKISIMQRDELFAALSILACVNGLASDVVASVKGIGWGSALVNTFGISVIVWAACATGVLSLLHNRIEKIRPIDLGLGVVLVLLVSLPIRWSSWLALTGLCLYMLFLTDGPPSRKRGAGLLLAVTFPMAWSRLLMHFFARPILDIDTSMVSLLLGTDRIGNMVGFADKNGYLVILPGCSSLTGLSLAVLCWFVVSNLTEHKHSTRDFGWCGLACASVILINVARLSVMGLSEQHYETLHSEVGAALMNFLTLFFVVGFCAIGVRRELFSRF